MKRRKFLRKATQAGIGTAGLLTACQGESAEDVATTSNDCQAANLDMLSEFTARNGNALITLLQKHQVELRQFPQEVIARMKQMTTEVLADLANADADSARIYASWQAFAKQVKG